MKFKIQKFIWNGWSDYKEAGETGPYKTRLFSTKDDGWEFWNTNLKNCGRFNEVRVVPQDSKEDQDMYDPG
jgi:hypothetical protein